MVRVWDLPDRQRIRMMAVRLSTTHLGEPYATLRNRERLFLLPSIPVDETGAKAALGVFREEPCDHVHVFTPYVSTIRRKFLACTRTLIRSPFAARPARSKLACRNITEFMVLYPYFFTNTRFCCGDFDEQYAGIDWPRSNKCGLSPFDMDRWLLAHQYRCPPTLSNGCIDPTFLQKTWHNLGAPLFSNS